MTAHKDERMPCGCYGYELRPGKWLVSAEAFLCQQKHKQGKVVRIEASNSHSQQDGDA